MKHIRKILLIVVLLAIVQVIHFGNLCHASDLIPPPILTVQFQPIIHQFTIDTITQSQIIDSVPDLYTPIIFSGSPGSTSTFSFMDEVILGLTTPPRPGPRGIDDPLYLDLIASLEAAGFSNPGGLGALGFTSPPRPGPRRDELGWASNAVFVDGILDLTGLSINVDLYNFLQPGDALAIIGATGGFLNFNSVQLKGEQAGSFMFLDPPAAAFIARVPEPSTMLLLGAGLLGLAVVGIRRRKKTAAK